MSDVLITRRFDFSSSHRYYRPEWSEDENRRVFGLCALPNGHGHNYTLEVSVSGDPDPETGMVINLVDLKAALDGVLAQFDHKHLNLDTPYFKDVIPTTENLAAVLWRLVSTAFECLEADGVRTPRLARLRLYEADDLFVEYLGESA